MAYTLFGSIPSPDAANVPSTAMPPVGAGVDSILPLDGDGPPQIVLSISGNALDRNVDAMFDLIAEVVTGARWRGEEKQVGSIHWFPYDRVGVVNADP